MDILRRIKALKQTCVHVLFGIMYMYNNYALTNIINLPHIKSFHMIYIIIIDVKTIWIVYVDKLIDKLRWHMVLIVAKLDVIK